ncbi:MAG: hypothetical protein GY699_20365 [Desulfobacteraceae bacterium]|nr:hypothetical protein [Desulfobacteraceae bacterium]
MTRENLLSVLDIAKELNTGKATTKFLLKRFEKWVPYERIDGQRFYPNKTIKVLFRIQEKLDAGLLPGDIEEELNTISNSNLDDLSKHFEKASQNDDIRLSSDGLGLLKSLFNDIGDQQKRIAAAHEKRAAAEERKAVAIEKRAGAEEKKADAMNNIANALQEMNQLRASEPAAQQIVHEAAAIVATDEINEIDEDISSIKTDEIIDTDSNDDTSINKDISVNDGGSEDPDLDDLSALIEENDTESVDKPSIDLDDLSLLIDDDKQEDSGTTDIPSVETQSEQLDDLSLLIDAQPEQKEENLPDQDPSDLSEDLDDLSALIDQSDTDSDTQPPAGLDDLSKLIDDPSVEKGTQSDSSVKEESTTPGSPSDQTDMDDLSILIDDPDSIQASDESLEMDDLSKLIDDSSPVKNTQSETPSDKTEPEKSSDNEKPPEISIDISPAEDKEKYKAAVMKIILGFKTDGLDVEETTKRLNDNKIKTLSGKPEWSQKAISQVYKFIDSAK